jgi:peptidoglycan/LPS O-acetylase OafA/YrhL
VKNTNADTVIASASRFPALDGIRGLAIGLVILHHLGVRPPSDAHRAYGALFDGGAGIRLFFVLSGFLITTLLLTELRKSATIDLRAFWIRRLFRLGPALVLVLGAAFLLREAGILSISDATFWLGLFCMMNFAGETYSSAYLLHLWSLSVEAHFYLVWPLVVGRAMPLAKFVLAATLAVCLVQRYFLRFNPWGWDYWTLYYGQLYTIPAIDAIAVGCVLALLRLRFKPGFATIAQHWKATSLVLVIFWCVPFWLQQEIARPLLGLFQAAGCGLLILLCMSPSKNPVQQLFAVPALVWVGTIAYELYLWQGIFLGVAPTSHLWFQQFPQNLGLSLVLATITWWASKKYLHPIRDLWLGAARKRVSPVMTAIH